MVVLDRSNSRTMRATLVNVSSRTRRHWAQVTFPRQAVSQFGHECTFVTDDGRRFRAVKGRNRGLAATVYRIRMTMDGHEWLRGTLQNQPHADAHSVCVGHRWTVDDIQALVPDIGVLIDRNVHWSPQSPSHLLLVDSSPAHHRWFLRKPIAGTGLVFEWWGDLLHQDPVIPAWGKLVWSDRNDPNLNRSFGGFIMKSGEYFHLDYGRRHGSGDPVRDTNKQWQFVLGTNINLNDGAGLPLSGRMLSFVGPTMQEQLGPDTDLSDMTDTNALDFSSLQAAAEGPIVGVCHEWNGSWCAALNIPRFHNMEAARTAANAEWNAFVASLENNVGWFGSRPYGISRTPGQTGGQEDFGATKGSSAVTLFDPRFILMYQYSVYADVFRGFMHYENNEPLRLENHPRWVTWSGMTHYHTGVSPDRLGKAPATFNPGSGFWNYDDEHRSQNGLAAYMALTDDPLTDDIVQHQTTTDLASYRMRYPNNGGGAARAQGRTAGAWANFAMLTEGDLRNAQLRMIAEVARKAATSVRFAASLPVPVLGAHGPDGRKAIFDETGALLPTWSVWEHGLAMVGVYNALKANPNDATMREVATRLARLLAQWGCFEDTDGWWLVCDMWYREGQPITGALSKSNNKIIFDRGGVATWTFAGVLVASELLPETDPLKARARACVAAITQNREAGDRMQAEWWAAVRSVV